MKNEYAVMGGGCFWCTEAVFEEVKGIKNVVSGYSGGSVKNPSYREVTSGKTGHAEVVQIQFNPDLISYREILEIFFKIHDPTTLNKQGADIGTQYRSVIFWQTENQRIVAEEMIKHLSESGRFSSPIVTAIEPLNNFYPAEEYHQDYFSKNPDQAYCSLVINPKVEKFRMDFSNRLKELK